MIKITLQLCPVARPDFIAELLHEKTFRDRGSGLKGRSVAQYN